MITNCASRVSDAGVYPRPKLLSKTGHVQPASIAAGLPGLGTVTTPPPPGTGRHIGRSTEMRPVPPIEGQSRADPDVPVRTPAAASLDDPLPPKSLPHPLGGAHDGESFQDAVEGSPLLILGQMGDVNGFEDFLVLGVDDGGHRVVQSFRWRIISTDFPLSGPC